MRILFCAVQPGSGQAILPLAQGALKKGAAVKIILAGPSKEVFKSAGLAFTDGEKLTSRQLIRAVLKARPDVFTAGASLGGTLDKRILKICQKNKVPAVYILDFWTNYWQRFSSAKKDFKYLPDVICVMDKRAKEEMLKEGFPSSVIKITGNPYFDNFKKKTTRQDESKKRILFISQWITELERHKNIPACGYDEFKVLEDVILVLSGLPYSFEFVLRLHPREKPNKFSKIIKAASFPIIKDKIKNIEKSLSRAGLIIGMRSVVLMQAALAGKKVISYQPGLRTKDILITNKLGLSRLIKNKKGLKAGLLDYFQNKKTRTKNVKKYKMVPSAASKVLDLISNLYYDSQSK